MTTMSGCGWPLVMLALMYWRCRPWREYRSWRYLAEPYASGRLPMEGYLRDVERAFREGWTLARWLGWMHYQHIWLQHRRVALEKLAARRQEVSQFEVIHEEDGGEPRSTPRATAGGRGGWRTDALCPRTAVPPPPRAAATP